MIIKFYGHSDDCIEVDGDIKNEYGFFDGDTAIFRVQNTKNESVLVKAEYTDWGTWLFGVFQEKEEDVFPDQWLIGILPKHDYSFELVINAGDEELTITQVE